MDFRGQTAFVTGAASGIGRDVARRLVTAGATVHAADLDPAGVPEGAVGVTLDVTDPVAVAAAVDAAVDATGRLDVLVNNAGIGSTTSIADSSPGEWHRVFEVNVHGVVHGIRAALPHMLDAGHGAIVNTASVAGMIGLRGRASYCASKGAVIALTRQVAVEYAGTGVRCNCVSPGTVDSPWVGRLLDQADDPVAAREALTARQPVGRLGTPDEVAAAIVYLASDAAGFVTGTNLVIDGGLTAA